MTETGDPWHTRRGIIMVVLGLSIAALTGAFMKLLSQDLTAYQITWFRFIGFAVLLIPVVIIRIGRPALKPARPGMQLIRGISLAAATVAFVLGARTIDYADAIAILYAYPFLLTVLAVFMLGERVGWVGWIGVVGGFAGVLMVMRPQFSTLNTGTLFVFLCAVIVSVQMALNRKLGAVSHPLVTSLWGAMIATAVLTVTLPFHWQPLQSDHVLLICLMAVSGAVSQTLIVFAFAKAPASLLAPFSYFEIIAAITFGYLFFGTLPTALSWTGMALIVFCGLMVARMTSTASPSRRGPKF